MHQRSIHFFGNHTALLLRPNPDFSVKLIATVNVVSIIIMVYELASTSYLIDHLNSKFEFGRLQGLFSYSKEAGYYVIAATFYLFTVSRFSMFNMTTLILLAILSGTRTAMLFVLAVCTIKFINSVKIMFVNGSLKCSFLMH